MFLVPFTFGKAAANALPIGEPAAHVTPDDELLTEAGEPLLTQSGDPLMVTGRDG